MNALTTSAQRGAELVRCDLRGVSWAGRKVGGVKLIDCRLGGARGVPELDGEVTLVRPDVGQGSEPEVVDAEALLARWRQGLELAPASGSPP